MRKACLVCGDEFNTKGCGVTCSERCAVKRAKALERAYHAAHQPAPIMMACVICGATFRKRTTQITCSKKCAHARKIARLEVYRPRRNRLEHARRQTDSEYRERRRTWATDKYWRDREKILAQGAAWRRKQPGFGAYKDRPSLKGWSKEQKRVRTNALCRVRRAQNPEKHREINRCRRAQNPEYFNLKTRSWRRRNRDKMLAYSQKLYRKRRLAYEALKALGAAPDHIANWQERLYVAFKTWERLQEQHQ